jgi:hypothetical protein
MAVVVQQSITAALRHLKVTGHTPAFGYEPCEDVGCTVTGDGHTSSCGRQACPSCGCSGTNMTPFRLADSGTVSYRCTCGHSWVRSE